MPCPLLDAQQMSYDKNIVTIRTTKRPAMIRRSLCRFPL